MIRYYDRKTGKRVSALKWKRSHARGGTRYVRRVTKGKRVPPPPSPPSPKETPDSAKMWRLTVASPYFTRQAGKNKSKGSPDSNSYMIRGWFTTRSRAEAMIHKFTQAAEAGRESAIGPGDFIRPGSEANVEIKSVPYDADLIGKEEEHDERIR